MYQTNILALYGADGDSLEAELGSSSSQQLLTIFSTSSSCQKKLPEAIVEYVEDDQESSSREYSIAAEESARQIPYLPRLKCTTRKRP
jgi:hypothetical protein